MFDLVGIFVEYGITENKAFVGRPISYSILIKVEFSWLKTTASALLSHSTFVETQKVIHIIINIRQLLCASEHRREIKKMVGPKRNLIPFFYILRITTPKKAF